MRDGGLSLPPGVSYAFAGEYENQLRALRQLALVIPATLAIIFAILYLQFRSLTLTHGSSSAACFWPGRADF